MVVERMARFVGRRFDVANGASEFMEFGPFQPGERVSAITVFASAAAPTAGDQLICSIRAHPRNPISLSEFTTGRLLTGNGEGGDEPRLPVELGMWDLPVGWVADGVERFLGLLVVNTTGEDYDGSVWVWVEGGSK